MRLARFEQERAEDWARLDALLAQAGDRPDRLGSDGVRELARRYRAAAADLAAARRLFPAEPLTAQLEARVARARKAVYVEAGTARSPLDFVLRGYWQAVRDLGPALLLSVVLFCGAVALATTWGASDPDAVRALVPADFIDAADPPDADQGLSGGESAAFSSAVLTNNIMVSLTVFAAGILFGVGGAALLLYNALILGAVFGIAIDAGNLDKMVRQVASHGVLELSCIVVAAAAGMRFGWALVDPGPQRRTEALQAAARPTIAVVLGTAPLLVLAGVLEGFVSPAGITLGPALLLGGGVAAVYWLLVAVVGRSAPRSDPAP